jgi:hypothetical protein
MYKIMVCLVSFLFIAALLLKLRSERMNWTHQSAHLFQQINRRQQILWDLQTRIAAATNPLRLAKKLKTLAAASTGAAGPSTPGASRAAPGR